MEQATTLRAEYRNLILRGLAGGQLKPGHLEDLFIEPIVEAHQYLESNQQIGKIVVTTGHGAE